MAVMPRRAAIRCSDADRDTVAAALRRHVADGRLTITEFEERLDGVLHARTYGDLDAVTSDLPRTDDALAPPRIWPRPSRRRRWSRFVWVNGMCWTTWLVFFLGDGGHELVWPLLVTVPWVAWRATRAVETRRPHLPPGS